MYRIVQDIRQPEENAGFRGYFATKGGNIFDNRTMFWYNINSMDLRTEGRLVPAGIGRHVNGKGAFMAQTGNNFSTIIVCLILAVLVALAIRKIVVDRRNGRNRCGNGCGSCPMSGTCGRKKKG